MLNQFFQPLYNTDSIKNLIDCFQLSPDVSSRMRTDQSLTVLVTYSKVLRIYYCCITMLQKMRICCSQLHCTEYNVPGINFSIKQLLEKKHERLYRVTNRTALFRRHAVHRTGYSRDDIRGVDGQENACPPVAYISGLIRVSSHAFQLAGKMTT